MKLLNLFIFTLIVNFVSSAHANYEMDRLMDSYLIAKADNFVDVSKDAELEKIPYTIQVASYLNEKDAVAHVEELRLQEKDVFYVPVFIRNQVWFKVCVGKFATKDLAENFRKSFIKKSDEPFAVVVSLLNQAKSDRAVSAEHSTTQRKRKPASIAKKEHTPLPITGDHGTADTKGQIVAIAKTPTSKKGTSEAAAAVSKVMGSSAYKDMVKDKSDAEAVLNHEKAKQTQISKSENIYYSIQIGAFPTEELAKNRISNLKIENQELHYRAAMVDGKKWYRVFIGKFPDKKDALNYQKEFNEKIKMTDSFIRRMISSEASE